MYYGRGETVTMDRRDLYRKVWAKSAVQLAKDFGISDVAIVAFVRKRIPEIQYLMASISEVQRREFGQLVEATVGQIETAQFPSHPGIRFPQNGCVSCAHLGLCLGNESLVEAKLIRQPGASDLDWLNGLDD